MKKNNYSEKLKNPLWQRKRLEILNRDNFSCVLCNDDKTTLNIHHLSYSGEPWEVPNDQLTTLCEHCHTIVELDIKKQFKSVLKFRSDLGWLYLFAFDIDDNLWVYTAYDNVIEFRFSVRGKDLKTVVHFIINYWLKNDLDFNLTDYKKAS